MPQVAVPQSDVIEEGFAAGAATSAYFVPLTIVSVTSYATADTNFAAIKTYCDTLTAALIERRVIAVS